MIVNHQKQQNLFEHIESIMIWPAPPRDNVVLCLGHPQNDLWYLIQRDCQNLIEIDNDVSYKYCIITWHQYEILYPDSDKIN